MVHSRYLKVSVLVLTLLGLAQGISLAGPGDPIIIGMGDSIGEGVQSAEATVRSQPAGYLSWIAHQMAVPFALPLIRGGQYTTVESTQGRARIDSAPAQNLAVSGADVGSLLREASDAVLDTETDLVLFPRLGTQMSIAENSGSSLIVCWIGNNDILGAALAFDKLDASQLTPLSQFDADYKEITNRLRATRARIVVANIPDIDQIAFLFSPKDLEYFLGSDFGMPDGSYTSLVAMLLLRLGVADATLLQNPDWVLDAQEIETIHERTLRFNEIIAKRARETGAALVDVNALFAALRRNPPVNGSVRITRRFNGGLFSLDGVHPSNLSHAVLAGAFIAQANRQLGLSIPPVTTAQFAFSFQTDPFVDKDGDGLVTGRPGAGLIESLMPTLGFSGDSNDTLAGAPKPTFAPSMAEEFMLKFRRLTGRPETGTWNRDDVTDALAEALGLKRYRRR